VRVRARRLHDGRGVGRRSRQEGRSHRRAEQLVNEGRRCLVFDAPMARQRGLDDHEVTGSTVGEIQLGASKRPSSATSNHYSPGSTKRLRAGDRILRDPSAIGVAALRERRSAGEMQRRSRPGGVELAEPDDRAVRRQAFDLEAALAQTVQRGWVGAHP
jgi:hypothetical protein